MDKKFGTIIGAYILVEPEIPIDQITARGMKAGLFMVLEDKNKPKASVGTIVALGIDPHLEEIGFKLGLRVSFSPHSGDREMIEGTEYRLLGYNEIKRILPPTEPVVDEHVQTKRIPDLPFTPSAGS